MLTTSYTWRFWAYLSEVVAKDTGFGEIYSWLSVRMHHSMPVYLAELDYKLPVVFFLGLEV
jgi:hypothetical protein